MNTCDTCKWWKREEPSLSWGEPARYNVQINIHIKEWDFARDYIAEHGVSHQGDCSCPKFQYDNVAQIDGLAYEDAESYAASFRTGAKFGCIHWEAK